MSAQRAEAWVKAHKVWTGIIVFVVLGAIGGATNPSKPASHATIPPPPVGRSAPPPLALQRSRARNILLASVDHYQRLLELGQAILGTQPYADGVQGLAAYSDPASAASRFRDYRKRPDPENDLSFQRAFTRADHIFTADNEPQAISDWQADMSDSQSALVGWVQTAVGWQISEDSTGKLNAEAATVRAGLAKARRDALRATS